GSNRDPEIDVLRLYSRYQEGGIENFRPGPLVFPGSAHLVTVLALRLVIPSIAMLLQVPQGLAPLHSRFMIGSTAVRPACHRLPPGGQGYLAQADIPRRGRFAEATRSSGGSHRRIGLRLPSAPVASTISSVSRPRGINLMRWRASRLMVIRGANSDMLASTTL